MTNFEEKYNKKKESGKAGFEPTAEQKLVYEELMSLYDRVENILVLTEKHPEEAKPYIKDVKKLAKNLENYIEGALDGFFGYMESGKVLSGTNKLKLEKNLKNAKITYDDFYRRFHMN